MKNKTKMKFILCIVVSVAILFLAKDILDDKTTYDKSQLESKAELNIFKSKSNYLMDSYNALVSYEELSTGMYTDSNRAEYFAIFKVSAKECPIAESEESYIKFESRLSGTTEWVVENEYKITMYYILEDEEIEFYSNAWIGSNDTVSGIEKIPVVAQELDVYVKYESLLKSFMFFKNGNDVRFHNNYLAVSYDK